MGEKMNGYSMSIGKPEGKGLLGRTSCRWVDNIELDLRARGLAGKDWTNLTQDRDQCRSLFNTVTNLR
jgi:hypothetical protein